MSATQSAAKKAKVKAKKAKAPVKVSREPSSELRYHLRATAQKLLKENFNYREAIAMMRLYLLSQAHAMSGGEHTKAGAILGISRDHARDYYQRGGDLVR